MEQGKTMTELDEGRIVLDLDALKAAFMGDDVIIKQILQAFQDTFRNFQSEFDRLHKDAKWQELSRLVHGLKGSSANIRAAELSHQAASLQQQIDQKQDYTEAYHHVLSSLSHIYREIDAFIAS